MGCRLLEPQDRGPGEDTLGRRRQFEQSDPLIKWEFAEGAKGGLIFIQELVENVTVPPDHLEVTVSGAPRLHVLYQEVGLKESYFSGVGGGTNSFSYQALAA